MIIRTFAELKDAIKQPHEFEAAGLGKPPYRYLRMECAPAQCHYCGTRLQFQHWLASSDDNEFMVGCDCVYKAASGGFAFSKDLLKQEMSKVARERPTSKQMSYLLHLCSKAKVPFCEVATRKDASRAIDDLLNRGRLSG